MTGYSPLYEVYGRSLLKETSRNISAFVGNLVKAMVGNFL